MLTSKVKTRLPLPHEDGEWVEIRKLSHQQIAFARDQREAKVRENAVAQLQQVRFMNELGDLKPVIQEYIQSKADSEVATETEPAQVDPLELYDRETLLQCGIVAWSYDEKVSPESISDLDEETANFVARAIAPQPLTREERKNSTPPSSEA